MSRLIQNWTSTLGPQARDCYLVPSWSNHECLPDRGATRYRAQGIHIMKAGWGCRKSEELLSALMASKRFPRYTAVHCRWIF